MASIAAFLTSIIFNGCIGFLVLIIFSLLRPKFDYVYQPYFKLLTEYLHDKIPETKHALLQKIKLSPSVFSWLTPSFKLADDDLYELVGFDAFVYLRFLRLCFKIAAVSSPYVVFVLIPINVVGDNKQDGLDILTLGNIEQTSNKLWAHLIGVWLVTALIYYFFYVEWRVFVKYRQQHLKEDLTQHYSVLVTRLPQEIVSYQKIPVDEDLTKFMEDLFPSQISFCYVVENTEKWQKFLNKHDALVLKLEHSKAVFYKKGERPRHRLKPLCGRKVDSITYYDDELKKLQDEFSSVNDQVSNRIVPVAIVTFKSIREASIANQVTWQALPYNTMVQPCPEPRDIIWNNMGISLFSSWMRWFVITALLLLLVVFWMIPVTFIQSIVTLESLQKKLSFIKYVTRLPSTVVGLIEGVLSTVAFVVFFALLPMIMDFMSRQEGILTCSGVAAAVVEKLFVFTMVNKFFGSVLAGAFFDKIEEIMKTPTTLPKLLAMSLPSVATFFINIIILKALTGHALTLLRIVPLIVCNLKRKWLAKTEREQKMAWSPAPPNYGVLFSEDLFVFIISITYCIQAPIVIPFAMLYFGFGYIVHFYLMVYVERPPFTAGGTLWFTVYKRMIFAVVVFHILMIGIFALKNNPAVSILAIPPMVLTIIFHIFINMYWKRISLHMEMKGTSSLPLPDEGRLKSMHEVYIRNRKIPSLYALTSDNDVKDDQNKNDTGDLLPEAAGSVNLGSI